MKIWGIALYLTKPDMGYWWRHYSMKFSSPGIRCHALYFLKRFLITWDTK